MPDTPAEPSHSYRVGLLSDGTTSDEQRAARSKIGPRHDVTTVELHAVSSSTDLQEIDVLWWHREEPLEAGTLTDEVADVISAFVTEGGGLLLSLYALTAVDDLDIDPHVPDTITEQSLENRAGLLVKSRFSAATPFEDLEGLRVHTQATTETPTPTVYYDQIVPKHGEVLASAVRGDTDRPEQNTAVAWTQGEGAVLGVGQHLDCGSTSDPVEGNVDALIDGIVRHLAGENDSAVTGRPKSPDELTTMRDELSDHLRPQYHFTPPANWLNDPNGLIEWEGTYHMFYQYNPAGPYHGSIHWGHATSDDLVHWEDRPVALEPDPGSPDEHGCWSGCAINADGTPTFVYTGGSGGDQLPCLAEATDDSLDDWEKHPANPVIDDPQAELDVLSNDRWNAEFRDHDVWREDGTWYQLIGAGIQDEGGTAILYTSENLLDWELVGPILTGDAEHDGVMWECPELLRFEAFDLLQVSNYEEVCYYTGRFDGDTFDRQGEGVTDYGNYYAAQTMEDSDGRYLSWGWIKEDRDESAQWDAGWSGVMSLPRVVWTDEQGDLRMEPAPETTALRGADRSIRDVSLEPGTDGPFEDLKGDALEIELAVDVADAEAFELIVGESPGGEERTPIRYTASGELIVERSESSRSDDVAVEPQRISDVPDEDGELHLQVFLDGSVIELFVNGRTTLSSRIYPTRTDATGVSFNAVGGTVEMKSATVWKVSETAVPSRQTDEASETIEEQPQ